ncbi:NAD(P)-binding protein [Aspergillus saccharolyticus JOP 1030-1]|uniref:NAD(P)-binding protein n=1 Tax=Aspergillus saccharolyticus JOP 1030-1 TaxID=1450539 RepID=A0A318ZYR3_9EURO|nr:NAD(P)-binding protein [Aspergillus saccharolyticus JOP 1030-1]PYH49340.1 NAD(P)-binding protein [Aspergillus saccharolyticus JOP 1030-1]
MSPIASANHSNEETTTGAPAAPYVSTMPPSDFNWQITLSGKVVAITGGNRGIGLGIAEVCLANAAQHVYSLDLMEPGEEALALQKRYPNFHSLQADVTSEESVEKAITQIVEETGRIDGLFEQPELEQLFNLNVFGSYFCAQIVARKFIELGIKGSIVMTAATADQAASAVYICVNSICVNSISPGFVRTAMTYYVEQSPDWGQKMENYGGMPRLADPHELGGAYVYLLSDCSSYSTTGIDIPIAGVVGAW